MGREIKISEVFKKFSKFSEVFKVDQKYIKWRSPIFQKFSKFSEVFKVDQKYVNGGARKRKKGLH